MLEQPRSSLPIIKPTLQKNGSSFSAFKAFFKTNWTTFAYTLFGINLCLSVISASKLFLIVGLLAFFAYFLMRKIRKMREVGLISLMPAKIKHVLTSRSIFDLLCDSLYVYQLDMYVKAFIGPFFLTPEPEMLIKTLDSIEEEQRRLLVTKGIIYVLPEFLRKWIVPRSFKIQDKIHRFMDVGNYHQGLSRSQAAERAEEAATSSNDHSDQKERLADEAKDSTFINLTEVQEEPAEFRYETNKVLIGSEMLKKLRHLPGKVSETWDGLEAFQAKQAKVTNFISEKVEKVEGEAKNRPKSVTPLVIIGGIIEARKRKMLSKVSIKWLVVFCTLCLSGLGGGIFFVRKYRKLAKEILFLASYFGLLGLGAGTTAAIILKLKQEMPQGLSGQSPEAEEEERTEDAEDLCDEQRNIMIFESEKTNF